MQKLIRNTAVQGLDTRLIGTTITLPMCEQCIYGKATYSSSSSKTTSIKELIHSDLMGPFKPRSRGGHRYFLTFIDDFPAFAIYFLKRKSETFEKFKLYHAYLTNQQWRESQNPSQ